MGKKTSTSKPLLRKRRPQSGGSLLAKANTTTWVLLAVVVGLSAFLLADFLLAGGGEGPFVNPYADKEVFRRKSLLEDKRSAKPVPQHVVEEAMGNAKRAWERNAFKEAMGYIEALEDIGTVGGGVLNNKGVIAWDSEEHSLAFNIFCDAIEIGVGGVKRDALTNIANMWLETQFIFTDMATRERVGEHVLTGVLTQPSWPFTDKFNGCRLLFRNAMFDKSVQAYRHILTTPGISESDKVDCQHNLGMAMVFMGHPDGLEMLRKSQLSLTRDWPFPDDEDEVEDRQVDDNIKVLLPNMDSPHVRSYPLDLSKLPDYVEPGTSLDIYPKVTTKALSPPHVGTAFYERPVTMLELTDVLMEQGGIFHGSGEFLLIDVGIFQFLKKGLEMSDSFLPRVYVEEAILVGAWTDNYYHWVGEAMSRLAVLKATGFLNEHPKAKILVAVPAGRDEVKGFVMESLGMLGVGETSIIFFYPGAHQFKFGSLYFPSYGRWDSTVPFEGVHTQMPTATALRTLRRFLAPPALRAEPEDRNKVVFLSRGNTFYRAMMFERELLAELRNLVGEDRLVVHGEHRMTLLEQREMLSEAVVVLGGHGAGLTNVVFCEEGTAVIELPTNNHFQEVYYASFSAALGLRHVIVPSVTANYYGPYVGDHHVPTIVQAVREVLEMVEA